MADRPEPEFRPDRQRSTDGRSYEQWYRLTGIGLEFIVSILLFGGLGWWLDTKLDTRPWLMLTGGAVGFGTGLWLLIRAAYGSFRD